MFCLSETKYAKGTIAQVDLRRIPSATASSSQNATMLEAEGVDVLVRVTNREGSDAPEVSCLGKMLWPCIVACM